MSVRVPDLSMDTSNNPPSLTNENNKCSAGTQSTQGGTFQILRTLGEGAYGEVKLVVDRAMQCAVAMKCMDLSRDTNIISAFRKEALLQRMLSQGAGHDNIIRYIGMRVDERNEEFQIMIEYADGGELFDQIEPDVGMPRSKAQHYFRQLISGVEYIHQNGIAHRDIKPENLLLTKTDTLKISDFGMATVFRYQGKERVLDAACGTLPYASPEVLRRRYHGPAADIWSCGIVLVALLAGELPWAEPKKTNPAFAGWIASTSLAQSPWKKIDNEALSLLRAMLTEGEATRATIERIRKHPWFTANHGSSMLPPTKRRKLAEIQDESMSQPMPMPRPPAIRLGDAAACGGGAMKFSQPDQMDDMYLSASQFEPSQNLAQQNPLEQLARRMTRFCVGVAGVDVLQRLASAAACLGFQMTSKGDGHMISNPTTTMAFMVHVCDVPDDGGKRRVMVDFRRSKGDGLEFKRAFVMMRSQLADVICTQATQWLEQQGLTPSQVPVV